VFFELKYFSVVVQRFNGALLHDSFCVEDSETSVTPDPFA